MKDLETKERFIELRGKGYSFDRIAREIDVSKPTLIKWHGEFEREIANVRFLHIERLMEKYGLMKQARVEAFGEMLQNVLAEIKQRDLTSATVKDLIALARMCERRLDEELQVVAYRTGESVGLPGFDMRDLLEERTIGLGA